MTVTVDSFKVDYPEFANAGDDLIAAKLGRVDAELSASEWGDYRDQAVNLRTAHALALAPHGEKARRVKPTGELVTIYWDEYLRLRARVMVPATASGGV